MRRVNNSIFFILSSAIIIIFTYLFFFSKKNFFVFIENLERIATLESNTILKRKDRDQKLVYQKNFQNNKEFRKKVIKEKLFLKDNNEEVLLYEFKK